MEIEELKERFAFYGFIESPLTDEQLQTLLDRDLSADEIYNVGCDVDARAITFEEFIRDRQI